MVAHPLRRSIPLVNAEELLKGVIDKDKAQVYEILSNVACKALIVVVFLVSWVVLLGFLIWKPTIYLGVVTALLPLTLVIILKHYFK
jgi:hypothetical protein